MQNTRFCPVCGTENENDFVYCKNCGTHLPIPATPVAPAQPVALASVEPVAPAESAATPAPADAPAPAEAAPGVSAADEGAAPPTPPPADETETVCGVSVAEAATFVGPGANKYIPAFKNIEQGSSSPWNWPVFLFYFFLNIPFVWFFYRKMYKVGTLVLAVSSAISLAVTYCAGELFTAIFKPIFTYFSQNPELLNHISAGSAQADLMTEIASREISNIIMQNLPAATLCLVGIVLLCIVQIVFLILISVFTTKLYYKHCTKKLQALRQKQGAPVSPLALRMAGGTNTGAAVALGVALPVVFCVLALIPVFSVLSEFVQAVGQSLTV